MFVILTYDIAEKRVAKVMKICRKYLTHVQKSVFEGMITEGKLEQLKSELEKQIVCTADEVCIYKIGTVKYTSKEKIGLEKLECNIL